jgi:ferric-dicitrate binding protein FerR (iron transport regulator)
MTEKDRLLSDESTAGAQIERLKQEVESLRAENAALRKAKAPRRRRWGGFVLGYLVLAALIGVGVVSSMSKNRTLESTFDQISRALQ